MSAAEQFINASEAARQLGVSTKALRLYEERGLIHPLRSAAGWRAYGPAELQMAGAIDALRALGLSLTQIGKVLRGDAAALDAALAAHQGTLDLRLKEVMAAMDRVREMRTRLHGGEPPAQGALTKLLRNRPGLVLDLPWPWGGERFELKSIVPLTWIVGPLGSGKTRLAEAIAATVPGGVFVGLDRSGATPDDPAHAERIASTLDWLHGDGATPSDALSAVVSWLERQGPAALVVDLVEQGLDRPTQEALAALLRQRATIERPLFLMTRSTAMLDLDAVGAKEAIIYCPANHSPPMLVAPHPGAPGYEAVATCLASPDVRARTAGVIAVRPPQVA
ncbi:MAG: MerR family transcriptional regulator [Devosia sp.]